MGTMLKPKAQKKTEVTAPKGRPPKVENLVGHMAADLKYCGEVIAALQEAGLLGKSGATKKVGSATQLVVETNPDGSIKIDEPDRHRPSGIVRFITVNDEGEPAKPVEELHQLIKDDSSSWWCYAQQFAGATIAGKGKALFKGAKGRMMFDYEAFCDLVVTWNDHVPQEYITVEEE